MTKVKASAPGKLVVLGEYAVLDGARALVLAVNRRCRVSIGPADGPLCRLETRMPEAQVAEFAQDQPSGVGLVDLVRRELKPVPRWDRWSSTVDSAEFFEGNSKLGLGSSAAVLVAFAGAWAAAAPESAGVPGIERLIDLHRRFQGGSGSGLDVAAAVTGGAIEFATDRSGTPHIGSVKLPNSVGFAGIFAGRSASTPDLVAHYRRFIDANAPRAGALRQAMAATAARGVAAAAAGDGPALVAAIGRYGQQLEELGEAMRIDLVTAEHRRIGRLAQRFGVSYKVSGAGGGDMGLACGLDAGALDAFRQAAEDAGFPGFRIDAGEGLLVEEQT